MAPRPAVVFETLAPFLLRSAEISKCVQNQSRPDGFPVFLSKSLFSACQAIKEKRIALFKFALSKQGPAEIGLA
ncbi:hypothetical protein ACQRIT_007946 [Beauveria bassiana]